MSEALWGSAAPWPAPAKLNLCLHIVGRRADGYHLLQTAFQFIEPLDRLRFYKRPDGVIERCSSLEGVPSETDLVVRAARLLAQQMGCTYGVGIDLEKHIPLQAGLGGGSSDAATVLVALNQIWGAGLNETELKALGLKLGADVPVFVGGVSAWAEGVGEILTPCDFPETVYVVIKPRAAVSTAEIFQASELTRNSPITTIRASLAAGGRNDCTQTVRGRYPEVAEALDWLQHYGDARLTGTGACVFAAMPDIAEAERVRTRIPARWAGFITVGCNRSPLLARLLAERGGPVGA
jgi:4-diphosphocytidyl-2-C-methyl-D-erythritol kinase